MQIIPQKTSLVFLISKIQRFLAKREFISRLAVKVRNQCQSIVGYHLGETANSSQNGEFSLLNNLGKNCHIFVDVGANLGEWSDYFLSVNPKAKGYLFEPSFACSAKLQERFCNQENLVINQVAVCDYNGSADFCEEENYGEASSLLESHSTGVGKIRNVQVVTLDSTLPPDLTIDFLKIDTEGYDLKVIMGCQEILKSRRIRFLQFEYNRFWVLTSSTLNQAIKLIEKHDYHLFIIRSSGLHKFNYDFWGEFFRYANFLACRKEDLIYIKDILGRDL